MKILFSLTYYSPYISGLTIFVKRLAEEFAIKGYDVNVLCFNHRKGLDSSETINKVSVFRVRPWIKIDKGYLSGAWIFKSWQVVRSADIVVINLPQAEGFITAVIAKILGKKVVAVYLCRVQVTNKLIKLLLRTANLISLKLADKVVTLTEDYASHTKELDDYRDKMSYIYPLINKPLVDEAWKYNAKRKIGKAEMVIGVASRMASEKGLECLFEAIPSIKLSFKTKFKIVIAGPENPVGEEAYRKKIWDLAQKYKDDLIFLGNVPEEKMGSFYSLLDVLILPSINSTEAFGMVQVEAMMWGVPVVASDLPGVRIPVQKTGMGIIVPIRNSKKIAEAVKEIADNKSKYSNKQTVFSIFGYGKIYNQWKNLFFS